MLASVGIHTDKVGGQAERRAMERTPAYRLYVLGRDGHVSRRIDLECASDQEAVLLVSEHHHVHGMELWDGARLVATFPPMEDPHPGPGRSTGS